MYWLIKPEQVSADRKLRYSHVIWYSVFMLKITMPPGLSLTTVSNSSLSVTVLISGLSSCYISMSAAISEILCLDSREHMVGSQKQLDLCPFSSELLNLNVC